MYERIGIYNNYWSFLSNRSARVISLSVLAFCITANMSIFFSVTIAQLQFPFRSNSSLTLCRIELRKSLTVQILIHINYFVVDMLTLIADIIINVILVVVVIQYCNRRITLNYINLERNVIFSKAALNNSKVAFINCFFSALFHTFNYFIAVVFITDQRVSYILIFIFVSNIRHSFNIFIFLSLNKKFKKNLIILIPKWLSIKYWRQACLLNSLNFDNQYRAHANRNIVLPVENINFENITTRL